MYTNAVFEKEDFELVIANDPVIRLMTEGLIASNPPYDLMQKDSAYLLNEFLFYDFKDGMTIGEIGAGSGIISLLLGVIYKDMTIYFWSTSAVRRWTRDPERYYQQAKAAGVLK